MTKANSGSANPQAADQIDPKVEPKADETPITRAEVSELVRSAVADAMKPVPATVEPTATPATPAADAITRADLATAFADAVKPMVERIEALEGKTVVRSGEEPVPTPAKEEVKDVFRGALPGIAGRRK